MITISNLAQPKSEWSSFLVSLKLNLKESSVTTTTSRSFMCSRRRTPEPAKEMRVLARRNDEKYLNFDSLFFFELQPKKKHSLDDEFNTVGDLSHRYSKKRVNSHFIAVFTSPFVGVGCANMSRFIMP